VIGTTGWYSRLEEASKIGASSNIGVVYGSNFSLGVNLFYQIVERAAQLFSAFDSYDPFIEEAHHKFKKDAPSGTALVLQKTLAKIYGDRPVPVTSVRAGYIPGTHAVSFDSVVDTIRLEHTARSREGFAEGALLAAKWIAGRKGFYEFREVLEERLTMKEII
jgi:4-hydroxy-tetrahydrodipicolinate reductase